MPTYSPKDATPSSWDIWGNWTTSGSWAQKTYRARNSEVTPSLSLGTGTAVKWKGHPGLAPTYDKVGTAFRDSIGGSLELAPVGAPASSPGVYDAFTDSDYIQGQIMDAGLPVVEVATKVTLSTYTVDEAVFESGPIAGTRLRRTALDTMRSFGYDSAGGLRFSATDITGHANNTSYWLFHRIGEAGVTDGCGAGRVEVGTRTHAGATKTASGTNPANNIPKDVVYNIGRGQGAGIPWRGRIHEMRVYNRALTVSERQDIGEETDQVASALAHLYDFDGGPSTIVSSATSPVIDLSGYQGNTWVLEWWQITSFEPGDDRDQPSIEVLVNGTPVQTIAKATIFTAKTAIWERKRVALLGVDGESTVTVRFKFDPTISHVGDGEGWYIERPRILAIA